jgi:hypothetical protein
MIGIRLIGYFPVKELNMGHIFEFMRRMAEGKPVFEDADAHDEPKKQEDQSISPDPVVQQPEPLIRKNEDQTFPVVEIKRVTTHLDGDNIQIYCHFKNTWEQEVMLDKIRLLDTTHELDTFLRGGEDREFLVYKGPKLRHEYHEAQVDYKTVKEGDYFRAVYDVTFTYNPMDKSYTVNEMELHLPIRDIYE